MTIRLDQLPPCSKRSVPDDAHFQCEHPVVAGGKPFIAVHYSQCQQCKFAGWDAEQAKRTYRQRNDDLATRADFASRVDICNQCEIRSDNYCKPAGANCNLTTKLSKMRFECPIGKFSAIMPDSDEE